MANYSQITSFGPKDALVTGNPAKLIKGTEIDPELAAISTAIATKEDSANKNAANGYAGLDSSALLPDARLSSNVPLKNGTNTYTGATTFNNTVTASFQIVNTATQSSGPSTSAFYVNAATPAIGLRESDASGDDAEWDFRVAAEQLQFRITQASGANPVNWLTADRTSNVMDTINLIATNVQTNGTNITAASGTYSGSFTGFTSDPQASTIRWARHGNIVTISIDAFSATSATTAILETSGSMPSSIRPARTQACEVMCVSGGSKVASVVYIATNGNLTFTTSAGSGSMSSSGAKGVGDTGGTGGPAGPGVFTYTLV